ncbi:hypothetical protein MRX96_017050 [Rhipicephalus microplus]
MYRWHLVRSEQCVYSREHEDNEQALLTCRVAKTFWSLVGGAYHSLGVEWFMKRGRVCTTGEGGILKGGTGDAHEGLGDDASDAEVEANALGGIDGKVSCGR